MWERRARRMSAYPWLSVDPICLCCSGSSFSNDKEKDGIKQKVQQWRGKKSKSLVSNNVTVKMLTSQSDVSLASFTTVTTLIPTCMTPRRRWDRRFVKTTFHICWTAMNTICMQSSRCSLFWPWKSDSCSSALDWTAALHSTVEMLTLTNHCLLVSSLFRKHLCFGARSAFHIRCKILFFAFKAVHVTTSLYLGVPTHRYAPVWLFHP